MSGSALTVSTTFIGVCCVLAAVGRYVVGRTVKSTLLKELMNEAIASAELCACCFELIIVADNFGVHTYAIYLFALTIWWSKVWGDASACPYTHMEDMLEGNTSPRVVALKVWAQLMGGCCVYRFVQIFWWFEFAKTHEGRAFEDCTADLQVHAILGAFIEGIATLLCRLASRSLVEISPRYATIFDSFFGTSLVVAAFSLSGGYFNPMLATALKWGCAKHTNLEHIIVYWIGACTGAIASVILYKFEAVQRFLIGDERFERLKDKKE